MLIHLLSFIIPNYYTLIITNYSPTVKPVINRDLSSTHVISYIGNPNPVRLKCVADGFPEPAYRWNNALQAEVGITSTYVLMKPSASQFGIYTCEANNKVGSARHFVNVSKIGKCLCILQECQLSAYVRMTLYKNFNQKNCKKLIVSHILKYIV